MTTHITFCRICAAICGLVIDVEGDTVVRVRGDREHPLSQGYTCPKGRRIAEFHAAPSRLRAHQRRLPDGRSESIETNVALQEIGSKLDSIVAANGADSVALFIGTQTYGSTLTYGFAQAWFRAVGSRKLFSTTTIDQSAKSIVAGRMGSWMGGAQRFEDSDVWMLAGSNPLVSMQGGSLTGFPVFNGYQRLRNARERGLRLIVIDPRRTETAARSDIHLRPHPGSDAILYAGLIHLLFKEGLVDQEFCRMHTEDASLLETAVSAAIPSFVATHTGVPEDQLVLTARTFGRARKGMARGGTGPDMGPYSNLTEHLITCLNVICGRYAREGDVYTDAGALKGMEFPRAQVAPPTRSWERGYQSRLGYGLVGGQLPSNTLVEEILRPGPNSVRALIVSGGNPVSALPDPLKTAEAFSKLELLIAIDPFLTETSRLAHYVIAPAMPLERADHTRPYERYYSEPFAQYTEPVLPRPPGVIEDWEFFARLAQQMRRRLQMGSRTIEPDDQLPTSEEALEWLATKGRIPLTEVRKHPHGRIFDSLPPILVQPPEEGVSARFCLLPSDVAAELDSCLAMAKTDDGNQAFRLIVRRAKTSMNSLGRQLPTLPSHNPCFLNPQDMAAMGIAQGDRIEVASSHATVTALAERDDTLPPGVVSMSHGFGYLPGHEVEDPARFGTNPNMLVPRDENIQPINAMPQYSAIPVSIKSLEGRVTTERVRFDDSGKTPQD